MKIWTRIECCADVVVWLVEEVVKVRREEQVGAFGGTVVAPSPLFVLQYYVDCGHPAVVATPM